MLCYISLFSVDDSLIGSLANVKVSQCCTIFLCSLDVDVDDSLIGPLANVKVST